MWKRRHVVAEESLRVTFDGPGIRDGAISARQLGLSLVNLADAITYAHAAVRYDDLPAPKISIRETGEGSFWVDLAVLAESGPFQTAIGVLTGKYATAAANLGGIVGLTITAMGVLKLRKGRKVKSVVEQPADGAAPDPLTGKVPAERVVVTYVDGTEAVIPAVVWLASQNVNFQKAARDAIRPAGSEGIDFIKLEHTDSAYSAKEELVVTCDEVQYFDLPDSEDPITTRSVYEATVSPSAVNFEPGKKWRLHDRDRSFMATIKDKEFAKKVDLGLIHIGKHDQFTVMLQEDLTIHKAARPKTEYSIVRVISHVQTGHQEAFDFYSGADPASPEP